MRVTQLELELWDQLQRAQQMPEAIDLSQLLDVMEVTAAQLPEAQRSSLLGMPSGQTHTKVHISISANSACIIANGLINQGLLRKRLTALAL